MLMFLKLLLSAVLFFLIYKLLNDLFAVEDKRIIEKYHRTKTGKRKKRNPEYIFSNYIVLKEYKKIEYEKMLFALNQDMTAEQYVSVYLYKPLIYLIPIAISILFRFHIGIFSSLLLMITSFFKYKNRIHKAMDYRKIQIEEEAPNMIRYFITSIENQVDIKIIFERYLEISNYLKRDIELTILDMNTVKSDKDVLINALYNLDERLNVQVMREFITGLIDVLRGKDQHNYFSLLERELKLLTIRNLDRKTKRIQEVSRRYLFVLIFNYIFIQMSMIVVFIVNFTKQV